MTSPATEQDTPAVAPSPAEGPWRRNLVVAAAGAFTTLIAMTLLVPFMPVLVRELGVQDPGAVDRWSGIAYGATFLTAALTAPLWGALGDRFGRKSMLVRASIGMTVAIALLACVHTVEELVAVRLLVGVLGGYSSGAMILVADQTPAARRTWALGVVSTGILAGNVVGPLVGGFVPALVGTRPTFLLAAGLIGLAAIATVVLLREERPGARDVVQPTAGPAARRGRGSAAWRGRGSAARRGPGRGPGLGTGARSPLWRGLPHRRRVLVLLATSSLVLLATMSVEPVVTVYVGDLGQRVHTAGVAGILMAATSVGSVLAAPRVGRLADRIGQAPVIVTCLVSAGVVVVAQACVGNVVELGVLRLLLGLCLGGLLPCVTASVRALAPEHAIGRLLGYGVSAQYVGQVAGPVLGGLAAAQLGLRAVFVATGVVLLVAAAVNTTSLRRRA